MEFDFTYRSRRSNIMATRGMVSTSQPLAALAGLDMLRAGGTAADAAVACAAALSVVEPFSTGIGGDCFALWWDTSNKTCHALNSSGPAAKRASLDLLLKKGYMDYPLFNGEAVSVPGTVRGWEFLLAKYGRMTLKEVLQPAIHLAEQGYPVSELISYGWQSMPPRLTREDTATNQHIPDHLQPAGPPQPSGYELLKEGRAPRAGEIMTLPTLARTLRSIAAEGSRVVYEGEFSQALCRHVQSYGGWLEPDDLADFEPEWTEPIFADYHGYRLHECPPNGQGMAAIMAVKIADGFDLALMDTVSRTHRLIECMRIGFSEALRWVSDPRFSVIPYKALFSSPYIQARRELISPNKAISRLESGVINPGKDTVYLSVIDGAGNACSFINSLYYPGGTGLVVPGTGVLLQNRSALFNLDPAHPNHLEGGKRPYQTIIPALITRDNTLVASYGVMGGFMQPQGHLQVLVNLVDLNHNPQQALDMPRFRLSVEGGGMGSSEAGGQLFLEEGFTSAELNALTNLGHEITQISGYERVQFGGGQVILRDPHSGVLIGGSDPRRDGCAIGY